jgi:Tol biopolymer transport system component
VQRKIAFESFDYRNTDVYTLELEIGRVRRVTTQEPDERYPTFSRDGRSLYFSSNRSGVAQIYRISAEGGEAVQVTRGGGVYPIESDDRQFIYYALKEPENGIWRVPVDGGVEEEILTGVDWNRGWDLAASGIYYVSPLGGSDFSIRYFDLFRRADIEIHRETGRPHYLSVSPDEKAVVFSKMRPAESELFVVENFR